VSRSRQREWLTDILESAPSLAFLLLWRSGVASEVAGWIGAALAASVLIGFRICKLRFNPILLGVNIHLLIITPLIMGMFHLAAPELGKLLVAYAYKGVLVTIFLTGCVLTLLSREGFVGLEGLPRSTAASYSVALLVTSLAATVWTFSYAGSSGIGVALPIMALFGLRRLLIARALDSKGKLTVAATAGGAMVTFDSSRDS
jgi:hypothetical protein